MTLQPVAGGPDAVLGAFTDWAPVTLYPAQEEALIEVVSGSNVIVATPTGSGKSLVAAGYGAALLPREEGPASLDARIATSPLTPRLWRALGLAHRAGQPEPATRHMLAALTAIRQR